MAREIAARPDLASVLLQVKSARELSTAAYRSALRAFLSSGWPPTVEGAAAYIERLRGRRAASTVNKTLSALRKAFAQAGESLGLPAREMAVIKGAFEAIPGVKKAPPEVAVITEEERTRLLATLPLRIRLIAETLYVTGGKERVGRIPAELYRRILAEFPEGTYLFESRAGQHYKREYVSREIARAAKRVIGRSVSPHVLRHSRATDLLAATHHDAFSDEELFGGME